MQNKLQFFLQTLADAFNQQQLIKLTLSNKNQKPDPLNNVFIKPVIIKRVQKMAFTYRYATQDIFKNYDLIESLILIEKLLHTHFLNADLFTAQNDIRLTLDKNKIAKTLTLPASLTLTDSALQHDKPKPTIVSSTAIYLKELGITTANGLVKKDMQDKFKQINSYITIIDGILKNINLSKPITVADMGCGKGYLTFALYDYLTTHLKLPATVFGVEVREDLVSKCNAIAGNINYTNLHFIANTIQSAKLPAIDMLIALHACDTATDDALFKGIAAHAKIIICAPCCHKQIRQQMHPQNELQNITKHGILLERQAEIVTDTIRALILETNGYKTKIFDFIATEHTPKNVLIVAIKTDKPTINEQQKLNEIIELKKLFNLKTHYLETLF